MEEELNERIRQLEEKLCCLEDIIQHVSEGVILTDRNCRIVEFNPAKERMEQMNAQEIMGTISWESYTHSNREISEHQKVFDTGAPILNAYRPHAYVGDIPVYTYYSTYPVKKGGEVIGVYTISRNETILRELLYETIEQKRLLGDSPRQQLDGPKHAPDTKFTFIDFAGSSPQTKQLLKEAQTIAPLDGSVLIVGETGTGKEVLAQSIHNFGRENRKFVAINCAAIPESLLERTLFGSVKGAYTGAMDSDGLFKEAQNGTLFLDEINSMSTAMQAKLLRALQERCVRPVGSLQEYPIRCRLICASNEMPQVLIREKRLRQDLFYRISDFVLTIPPLRERKVDIPDLSGLFIRKYNRQFQKHVRRISDNLKKKLMEEPWPGNIRELDHVIRNLMLRTDEFSEVLDDRDFPGCLPENTPPRIAAADDYLNTGDLNGTLRRLQEQIIRHSLEENGGSIAGAARALGLQRQSLSQRMKRLGISAGE